MAKLLVVFLFVLLAVFGVAVGQAAETSRVALAIVVVIIATALSVPAALVVGLVVEQRRPRVVNHYDNRRIVIMRPGSAQTAETERLREISAPGTAVNGGDDDDNRNVSPAGAVIF